MYVKIFFWLYLFIHCAQVMPSVHLNACLMFTTVMQKWSSSEAPKTTVKRILLQEERESNSSASRLPGKVEKQHLKPWPPKESAAAHSIVSDTPATSAFRSKSQGINFR